MKEETTQMQKTMKPIEYVNQPERRSGTTTRIIDRCIQELFTTGKTTVVDHHPTRDASRTAFTTTMHRLYTEHPNIFGNNRTWIKPYEYKIEITGDYNRMQILRDRGYKSV